LIEKGINEKYGKPKRWRAKHKEVYFYIDPFGEICEEIETYDITDERFYNSGNYFQTREQAEKARELQKKAYQEVWE
ncbi:MAG: hypothetical protein HUJ88_02340, partial [Fusobacterium necrophorum]|nr:hypothetical protein [Fusobacterium necrophorum]